MVLCLKAAIRSPYLYRMKLLSNALIVCLSGLPIVTWAETSTSQDAKLVQSLSLSVPEYNPTPLKELINPKQSKRQYEVTWKARPNLSFITEVKQKLKASIKVKMTVVAKTGYIVDVEFVDSSNSKVVDEKIRKALLVSSLEPISGLDPNVVYTLEHVLNLK